MTGPREIASRCIIKNVLLRNFRIRLHIEYLIRLLRTVLQRLVQNRNERGLWWIESRCFQSNEPHCVRLQPAYPRSCRESSSGNGHISSCRRGSCRSLLQKVWSAQTKMTVEVASEKDINEKRCTDNKKSLWQRAIWQPFYSAVFTTQIREWGISPS